MLYCPHVQPYSSVCSCIAPHVVTLVHISYTTPCVSILFHMQLYCSMCTYTAPCMDSYTLRLCPPICITLPPILALFLPSEKWWLYNLCSHPWAFTDIGKTASTFSFILFSYSRSFLVDIHTYNTILFVAFFSQSGVGSISGYATLIIHVSGHQYIALHSPVDAPAVRGKYFI